jgi:heme exporter protein C
MKFLINPNRFNQISNIMLTPLIILSVIALTTGLVFAFYLSPNDYQQGSTVRIMYVHVPSAWLALLTFFIMTVYSIIGLAFKTPFSFIVNTAVAPIGATFTLICLITGSLWGKPMWGTWWVWDARLTSVAILFMLYLIIIFLKNSFTNDSLGEKITAIFIIVGSINLPIIKFSVDWWNTLHQKSSIGFLEAPSIHYSMLIPLCIVFLGFLFYFLSVFLIRFRKEFLNIKIENLHLDLSKE